MALPRYDTTLIDEYKAFLVKYGALATCVHGADGGVSGDYNDTTYGAYYKRIGYKFVFPDHVVTLVGWNDTYSRHNFNQEAPGDGAWIIKNSWGTDYVSYYDSGILQGDGAFAYEILNPYSFEKIYQYDLNGPITYSRVLSRDMTDEEFQLPGIQIEEIFNNLIVPSTCANTYKATGDDIITAIGTYMFIEDKDYTIWISVNGKEVYTQSGKSSYKGF